MNEFTGHNLETLSGFPCKDTFYDICSNTYSVDVNATICGDFSVDGFTLKDYTVTPADLFSVVGGGPDSVNNIIKRYVENQNDHHDGRGFIESSFGTGTRVPEKPKDFSPEAIIGISVGATVLFVMGAGALTMKLSTRSNKPATAHILSDLKG